MRVTGPRLAALLAGALVLAGCGGADPDSAQQIIDQAIPQGDGARLNLLVQEIARLVGQVLAEYHSLPKKLQGIKTHAAAHADISAQLQMLVHKR